MGPLGLFLTNTFGIRDKVVNAFKAIWNFVRDGAGKVANFIKGIPGKLGNIGQAIWGKIKDGWNAVGQFVREKVGSVATFIKDIPGKVGNVGSLIWARSKMAGMRLANSCVTRSQTSLGGSKEYPVSSEISAAPSPARLRARLNRLERGGWVH